MGAAAWVATRRPLAVAGPMPDPNQPRVRGVVHVHTAFSDGGGSPEEVARAARAAGLDFVAITDHGVLDAKPFQGYRDGVLVMVGTEVSTARSGHIVGVGLREDPAFRFSADPADAMDDIRLLEGFPFAAHPLSPRPDFRWTEWDLPGAWGLELINGDSQWRAAGWGRLAKTALLYGLNPRHALLGSLSAPDATLAMWDRLLARRPVPGIAGADAHRRLPVLKERAVRFPSYEALLGLAVNHVLLPVPLTGQAAADAAVVTQALAAGRSYVGLDALAPARGFFFVAERGEARATMGDVIEPAADLRLRAGGALPRGTRVRILRDGKTAVEAEGGAEVTGAGPGVYRVEARVPGWDVPWVMSNPIYVFDPARAAERARAAEWPEPPEPPPATRVVEGFDGSTSFSAECDSLSSAERPVVREGEGPDGSGAGRLAFAIGRPRADHPHVFCALVSRVPRDLRGARGLVLSLKGDGVYRFRVEVRDENPASADDGTEWWFLSVRTATEWRRVAVPFARLRSLNPRTDGRLDLDRVRALVLVLDKDEVKPGTRGAIWVDGLGLY